MELHSDVKIALTQK